MSAPRRPTRHSGTRQNMLEPGRHAGPRGAAARPEAAATKVSTDGRRQRIPSGDWLYGCHAVAAALANPDRRWRRLAVLAGNEDAGALLTARAAAAHVPVRAWEGGQPIRAFAPRELAALLPPGAVHQGIALDAEPLPELDIEDLIRRAAFRPAPHIVVLLDQVSDPHNVGAVLRSAAAFGALAVIQPEHGAPEMTGTLAKAASGGLEAVPLLRVVNLTRALDRLKEAGFWSCGLDEAGAAPLATLDLGSRVALVLGSEGDGLRRLVREHCDYLARLPTRGAVTSLNVSNAAAVALYELVRQPPGGGSGS